MIIIIEKIRKGELCEAIKLTKKQGVKIPKHIKKAVYKYADSRTRNTRKGTQYTTEELNALDLEMWGEDGKSGAIKDLIELVNKL